MSTPLPAFAIPAKNHAILVSTGALILLPLGVLITRYIRTFNRHWFWVHAGFMLLVVAPILLAGIAEGIKYTGSVQTGGHFVDPHKKMGLAILILVLLQVVGGIFIHFVKIPFRAGQRPPQNYFHAILGLIIIYCAFWQAHYGIRTEWAEGTGGQPPVPHSAYNAWLAWLVVFTVLYIAGLGLLPRQYAMERRQRSGGPATEKI